MRQVRVVRPTAGDRWETAEKLVGARALSVHATQAEATAAARAQLAASGGLISVCGRDGVVRRNIGVPPPSSPSPPSPVGATPVEDDDGDDVLDVLADLPGAANALHARAAGLEQDPDGEAEGDVEKLVSRALRADDGSPASLFFRGTGTAITVVLGVVLPALAAYCGITIRGAEMLGSTYFTVFVATIAWSGGIAVAAFVASLSPASWSEGHYIGAVAGGFSASSLVAAALGGATFAAPTQLAWNDVYRVLVQVPKTRQGIVGVALLLLAGFIWLVALAGLATYDVIGLVLGALAGIAIGLQAAHRVKVSLRRDRPHGPT